MSSRSTIIVTGVIATLAFGSAGAFARSGHSGGSMGSSSGHMSMGSSSSHMGNFSSHMGSSNYMGSSSAHMGMGSSGHVSGGHFHDFHHRHFFIGGAFVPYYEDYYDYDYEDCPLVRVRVATRHGPRWRWVPSCEY